MSLTTTTLQVDLFQVRPAQVCADEVVQEAQERLVVRAETLAETKVVDDLCGQGPQEVLSSREGAFQSLGVVRVTVLFDVFENAQ